MLDKRQIIEHLRVADILISDQNVKGSFTYMDFGLKLRDRIYSQAILFLEKMDFQRVQLSDIVEKANILKIDHINQISKNYFPIEGSENLMAAGHEIPFYLFIKNLTKHGKLNKYPSGFFHFGSVFRYPKKTKFPFSIGEKRTFLECYFTYTEPKDEEYCFNLATEWNRRFLEDFLHLPLVESVRPLITNKRFSKKTQCIDTITPLGRTVNTGMTYLHDDIFSKVFGVKVRVDGTNKKTVKCVHFGISDNTYFSYLINSHDGLGFRLLTDVAPYCVQVILNKDCTEHDLGVIKLFKFLEIQNISYKTHSNAEGDVKKIKKQSIVRGIPMMISVSKKEGDITLSVVYRGDLRIQEIQNLKIINEILLQNDSEIIDVFNKRKNDSVVYCNTVKRINSAVSSGKVAKIHLNQKDESVLLLESQIDSGEILGFRESQTKGKDLISGESTSIIAYISRRI